MAAQAHGIIPCKAKPDPAGRAAVRQVIMPGPAVVMVRAQKAKAMRVPQAITTMFQVGVVAPVRRVKQGAPMARRLAVLALRIVF